MGSRLFCCVPTLCAHAAVGFFGRVRVCVQSSGGGGGGASGAASAPDALAGAPAPAAGESLEDLVTLLKAQIKGSDWLAHQPPLERLWGPEEGAGGEAGSAVAPAAAAPAPASEAGAPK